MKTQRTIQVGSESLSRPATSPSRPTAPCVVRLGDTVVLTTACMQASSMPRDFLPLTVDYREYAYAAGRIPGGFFKREGRATEKETITARMIDRPLRPLFPPGYTNETQIISFVLSADGEHDPDILAINGASTALVLSEIPFYNPIAAVRVGLVDGQLVFNPTNSQRDVADLDLVVVGSEAAVMMVEAGANQLSEQMLLDCIWAGHAELQKIIQAQISMFRERGLSKPVWSAPEAYPQDALPRGPRRHPRTDEIRPAHGRQVRAQGRHLDGQKAYLATIPEDDATKRAQAKKVIETLEEEIFHDRSSTTAFASTRASSTRSAPSTSRSGCCRAPTARRSSRAARRRPSRRSPSAPARRADGRGVDGESSKKFLLTTTSRRSPSARPAVIRGPGRREIGHGVLAERSLLPFCRPKRSSRTRFASSRTSSSRTARRRWPRSAAASSALMDAGVPITRRSPASPSAWCMRRRQLSPPHRHLGDEDHFGDMDFKVAGTAQGHHRHPARPQDRRRLRSRHGDRARAGPRRPPRDSGQMRAIIGRPRARISPFAPRLTRSRSTRRRSAPSSDPAARRSARSTRRPVPRSTSRTTAA